MLRSRPCRLPGRAALAVQRHWSEQTDRWEYFLMPAAETRDISPKSSSFFPHSMYSVSANILRKFAGRALPRSCAAGTGGCGGGFVPTIGWEATRCIASMVGSGSGSDTDRARTPKGEAAADANCFSRPRGHCLLAWGNGRRLLRHEERLQCLISSCQPIRAEHLANTAIGIQVSGSADQSLRPPRHGRRRAR